MTAKLARILWVTLLVVAACGSPAATAPAPTRTPVVAPTVSSDPLDQAVIAFDGGHTRAEIKAALDEAFAIYELERTDENYSRAGSVLVALRQSAADAGCQQCSEMEILEAMSVEGGLQGLDFPEAAAWAVSAIQALE